MAAVGAGIHSGKQVEEVLEGGHQSFLLLGGLGRNYLSRSVEETPHRRANIVREADAHLRILYFTAIDIHVDERHILGEFARNGPNSKRSRRFCTPLR